MRRTTEQWEALLDGTTPGEWSVEIYHEDEYSPAAILTVDGDMLAWCSYGEDPTALMIPEDAALASVAPEAVAEVIRLRRTFGAWANRLEALSIEMESEGHHLNAAQISAVVDGIHLILKGDTNE